MKGRKGERSDSAGYPIRGEWREAAVHGRRGDVAGVDRPAF